MLFKNTFTFEIDNEMQGRELLADKCNFVNVLTGIYFLCDSNSALFDAKYIDDKLYMYCRDIRRTFFNPLITVTFYDTNLSVNIRYNKVNIVTVIIMSILFFCFGIMGIAVKNILLWLPLLLFWCSLFVSFKLYSKKIVKEFSRIYLK